jgi:predicted ArsR family transcriptional regulator
LKVMVRLGRLNVSAIAKMMRINYRASLKHLQILENAGFLQRSYYGRTQLYRLNEVSTVSRALIGVLDAWETQQSLSANLQIT